MSNKSLMGLIGLLAVVIVGWNSFFVVNQTERAIVLQFGKVVQSDVAPGLHFKLPFVQEAQILMVACSPSIPPPSVT